MGTVRISRRSSSSRWKNRSNSNPRVGAEPAVTALVDHARHEITDGQHRSAIQSLAPDLGRMSLNPQHRAELVFEQVARNSAVLVVLILARLVKRGVKWRVSRN